MGRIPEGLRGVIGTNIRSLRMKKYPERGGSKKCAEAFSLHIGKNVSPQQWSPWERGMRIPDEKRMEEIAEFFGVSVAFLREDHNETRSSENADAGAGIHPPPALGNFLPPAGLPPNVGSDFYWLFAKFLADISSNGLKIRLAIEDMDYLSKRAAEALSTHAITKRT